MVEHGKSIWLSVSVRVEYRSRATNASVCAPAGLCLENNYRLEAAARVFIRHVLSHLMHQCAEKSKYSDAGHEGLYLQLARIFVRL